MAEINVAGRAALVPVARVRTDARGDFRISRLQQGEYWLTTTVDGASEDAGIWTPPSSAAASPATHYRVHVTPGAKLADVRLYVRQQSLSSIVGRVLGAAGSAPLTLRLVPDGGERVPADAAGATTLTGPDGSFAFSRVPFGVYWIVADDLGFELAYGDPSTRIALSAAGSRYVSTRRHNSGRPRPSRWFGRAKVVVDGLRVTHVELPLKARMLLAGRVIADGVPWEARFGRISVIAHPADGDLSVAVSSAELGMATEGGVFELDDVVPVPYVLNVLLPLGYSIESVDIGGKPHASLVDLRDVRMPPVLTVRVTRRGAALFGVVSPFPPSAAAVIVFPTSPSEWINRGFAPRGVCAALLDQSGRFACPDLPPGQYHVASLAADRYRDWRDPSNLHAIVREGAATTVSVGSGETVHVVALPNGRWRRSAVPRQ